MPHAKLFKRLQRLNYYTTHIAAALQPRGMAMRRWRHQFSSLSDQEWQKLRARLDYYNRLDSPFSIDQSRTTAAADFRLAGHNSVYFLDLAVLLRHFAADNRFAYRFGDITQTMPHPTWVKSRPIDADNNNSILLKLNSIRHFYMPPDHTPYHAKKPLLVWRGAAHQSHRIKLLQQFYRHPLCDIGCVAKQSQDKPYHAEFLSIKQQQQYKFILSIEGNDVATNLKWAMASNCLCFMSKPKYETWFMEGTLQANKHYVALRDDYADLIEKVEYYKKHQDEALAIIANAQRFVLPFFNRRRERLIQLLVMQKYFSLMTAE